MLFPSRVSNRCAVTAACVASLLASLASGCAEDPQYIETNLVLEASAPGAMTNEATGTIDLPVRLETEDELMERMTLAMEVGVPLNELSFVTLDHYSVSLEWSIRNLADTDGVARIHLNGGNEYFYYVPINFVIDPDEDEEPPPLLGDIPIEVRGNSTITGVFREDQIREAAIDLDLITRSGMNPFAAVLQQHNDLTELTNTASGTVIPLAHIPHMIRYEVRFIANRHMSLEFTIRVRDHVDTLHDQLTFADTAELTVFQPVEFVPPPPVDAP